MIGEGVQELQEFRSRRMDGLALRIMASNFNLFY
jgi:hypothetical protein